jgi:hypothetical protein
MKPLLPEFGQCGELFHTPSGTAFADIPVKEHQETWPLRSKRFRSWLRRCHYEAKGEAASPAAIRSALDLLEARAQFDGLGRAIHIRTAAHAGHGEQRELMIAANNSYNCLSDAICRLATGGSGRAAALYRRCD